MKKQNVIKIGGSKFKQVFLKSKQSTVVKKSHARLIFIWKSICDNTQSASEYINFFKPFRSWPVIIQWFRQGYHTFLHGCKKYNQGSGRKEQRTNEQYGLGLTQVQEGQVVTLCIPLCICRLTTTCILREISTKPRGMLTHLDWSSLTDAGLSLMPTGLFCSSVSNANCPSPSPVANCFPGLLLPTPWLAFPCLLPVASRSWAQAFVWFRAKTDKGIVCLADHPHSVTNKLHTNVKCIRINIFTRFHGRFT